MNSIATPLLLEARNLVKHYPVAQGLFKKPMFVRALDGVCLELAAGETLAVVGESGCGKSTLARQVTMLEAPTAGQLSLLGIDVGSATRTERRRLRPLVQMVFQNPYASLNPRKRIGTILEEPLAINSSIGRAERRERSLTMMDRVGLRPEQAGRYPHMFSGGQRQRVAIARALMLDPRLVVADEPVSALDVSVQAQVLNLMMDLQEQTGVAYLFISHNLAVVEHIADRVLVMYLGRVVESGAKRMIFDRPRHPYTRALLASTPRVAAGARGLRQTIEGELPSPLAPPPGCAFHRRCPFALDRCTIEAPVLTEHEGQQVACHRVGELG